MVDQPHLSWASRVRSALGQAVAATDARAAFWAISSASSSQRVRGRSCPMSLNINRPRTRHGVGGGDSAGRPYERIEQAVHHQRRHIETTERLGAIAARHDRRRLAARADRAEAAFDRDPGHLAELVLVERRPTDRTERLDRLIDRRRPGGGLAARNLWTIRIVGCPTRRLPVVDMIDVRLRTRSGCSIAIVWAIMPPIDTPTTWAPSMPSASSRPTASAAMSLST